MKKCPNCGAETEGNFCPDCGTNLTDVSAQENVSDIAVSNSDESSKSFDYVESLYAAADNAAQDNGADNAAQDNGADNAATQDNGAVLTPGDAAEAQTPNEQAAVQAAPVQTPKKAPKKLIGIGIAAVILIVAACAVFMLKGSGSHFISKAYEAGTTELKIGELTYSLPSSWKLDDTYSNPNEFCDTQRYLVKNDDGTEAVDCYVKYCGESKYYGNSLSDYESKISTDEVVSENNLDLSGAEGKHYCTQFTDADGNTKYTDLFLVESGGSIFTFEFDTNDASHDENGMNTILNNAQFSSYTTPVKDSIVGNGKFTDSANSIMRELISNMKKNNDAENLGCGEFTYVEGSTKGGA